MTRAGWGLTFLTILLAVVTAASWPSAAAAATDWDADGYTDTDCAPLDPAVHPGATDYPDLAFEDMNCDGIDGDKAGAYFVQPSGSDGNVGTYNAPFQTIQHAIDAARTSATKSIYVATGTYNQHLSLPTDADGIRIYGGYEAGLWSRTASTVTTVSGSPDSAVLNGATDVVFQLMTLHGTNGGGEKNAYGIRATLGSEVALIRVTSTAGAGAAGADGSGGTTPVKAATGAAGHTQVVPQGQGGTPCDYAGLGGSSSQPGNGFDGGAGGTGGEETNDGENGQAGSEGGGGAPGGDGGPGGTDNAGDTDNPAATEDGKTGGTGATGAVGTNGSGGANDLNAAGVSWAGHEGTDGTNGGPGYGGGGGGGGAGDGSAFDWSTGAGGGQGGDGGGGGGRGTRGSWGGGSFGVYLNNSTVAVVADSTVQAGDGGRGGHGGAGATGGAGGDGGSGAASATTCGNAKRGGRGGDGGPGGQGGAGGSGGGGSGGPSVGIARVGSSNATVSSDSTAAAGTPGVGGTGPGAAGDGGNGQSGAMVPAGGGPTDFDGDGVTDASDSCVDIPRGTDNNGDGCPDRAAKVADTDGDGTPDYAEDDDGDGVQNGSDACPTTAAGSSDANGDGCPDNTGGTPGGENPGGQNPGAGNPAPDTSAPILTFSAKAQRALKAKKLGWSTTSDEACSVTVVAKLGKKKLGSLKKALTAGAATKMSMKLSRKAQGLLSKALKTRKKVTVTLGWACADGAGNRRAGTKKLVVKR